MGIRTRAQRWGAAGLVGVVAALSLLPPGAGHAQAGCGFQGGFAALRAQAGANVVGGCLEDERSTINGDVLQATTRGTLVWRKLDNLTAFTDGSRTWIAGPAGLATRTNAQRFPWEGDRQTLEALRQGGYVVYLRHGATDRSQQDTDPQNLANCATQRNLNDQGRAEARRIGAALQALGVPVGQVLSSEYCRAREFAEGALGRTALSQALVLPDPLPAADRQQNAAALRGLLGTAPAPGTVTVLVSHQPNLIDAVDVNLSVEGEAAVFRPDGRGGAVLVARFVPEEWVALAQILTGRQITA